MTNEMFDERDQVSKSSSYQTSAGWQVTPMGPNVVEVLAPQVSYAFEATKTAMRVQVFENNRFIERSSLERSDHDFILDAADSHGLSINMTIHATKDEVTTEVLLNEEKFEVKTAAIEHGLLLAREVKKRKYPNTRYVKLLADELRDHSEFREAIKSYTGYGSMFHRSNTAVPLSAGNGVILACAVVCGVCAFGGVFSCLWCIDCVEGIG